MRVAIISDSHIPARAAAIPDEFRELIADADHTIHAGDFETASVLDDIDALAQSLTAVHGNIDPQEIDLPSVAGLTVEGVTFVVTHGTLNPVKAAVHRDHASVASKDDWLAAIADTARARSRSWDGENLVGIGGHTHQVEDELFEGVRVLNPGSVTGADPADRATMMTVVIDDEELDVTLHEA